MKKLTIISFLANIALIFATIFFYKKTSTKLKDSKLPVKNIAIFTPTTHPSLQAIENGFVDTMGKGQKYHYEFTTFNANGKRTLMRSQAEEMVQTGFDLIFTIGAQVTQMAKEVTEKKQRPIPVVFSAVADPQKLNLVKRYESSGNNLTGVSEDRDFSHQLDILLYLKPDAKNITLVYNPSEGAGLESQKQEIQKYLTEKGISFKSLEVYQPNEIYQKVSSAVSSSDIIMVLKDNTVVSAIDGLIKLCNQHNVMLYASDLDSVDKGAVAAFGVHEYDYGVAGAGKATKILVDQLSPDAVPVTRAENFKLKVNLKALPLQGLSLSDSQIFLMRSGEIVE